jgi:glycosyltransferase involved in cell wall biosynthesis
MWRFILVKIQDYIEFKVMAKVRIGLPIYNGENFLSHDLESILAQTYSDFEAIVSDNASQDRTQEICHSFIEKDKYIRYYRNSTNLGLFKNFNQVFELSNGKYFQWMAHDDLLAPEFVSCHQNISCNVIQKCFSGCFFRGRKSI